MGAGEVGADWITQHRACLGGGGHIRHFLLVVLASHLLHSIHSIHISGCGADKQSKGLYGHDNLAACKGHWTGHVGEAGDLCGSGWQVCSWRNKKALAAITWDDAMATQGCYVYNAEQVHGDCVECSLNAISGSLAGVGRGCTHKDRSGVSCIGGGVINAGGGGHLTRPCSHDARYMDGVLCCQLPPEKPRITVSPPPILHTYNGHIFLLPCQASGSPQPHLFWYKDGRLLQSNHSRLTVLDSGDLLVSLSHHSDTGVYTCEAINDHGSARASSQVTVSQHGSGCSDGSSEGLKIHQDITACGGRWRGHVKRAWRLCARGWGVCNPRDETTLSELGWDEVTTLSGCYAYNAANTWGRCTKCSGRKMAGVGHKCGRLRLHKSSCLAQGRVDVFWPKRRTSCNYRPGLTSGVLCCRKRRRKSPRKYGRHYKCNPHCKNGGVCVGVNQCHCLHGYKGTNCNIPLCRPACSFSQTCVRPNKCQCARSKAGRRCRNRERARCRKSCLSGGRCIRGRCVQGISKLSFLGLRSNSDR